MPAAQAEFTLADHQHGICIQVTRDDNASLGRECQPRRDSATEATFNHRTHSLGGNAGALAAALGLPGNERRN